MIRALGLALVAIALLVPSASATDAALVERSLTAPTAWRWLYGVSADQIKERVDGGYRLIDVEVEGTSPHRFNAVFVRNQGEHRAAWWWYYGVTAERVEEALSTHGARLIDLEVYRIRGAKRYAVIMVRNTGADARPWWYYSDVTAEKLAELIDRNRGRLVDLETYRLGNQPRFAAIMVRNSGRDQKAWWWFTNLTTDQLRSRIRQHRARLVDIERRSNNRWAVILERGNGQSWWWYHGQTADQIRAHAAQNGARLIDLERYRAGGGTRFAVLMLDNSNAVTGRLRRLLDSRTDGEFGFQLERLGSGARASLQAEKTVYPASTIKVLQHLHLMRLVQAGSVDLDRDSVTKYPNRANSCASNHRGHRSVRETLRQATRNMMRPSDNQSTNALQEFFGDGDSDAGRAAIDNTSRSFAGLSGDTAIRHKFDCGGPSNNPANAMTLTDMVRLYRRLAAGEILDDRTRGIFYANMANERTDRFIGDVIDQEAPPGVDVGAFKRGVRMAHKAGNWGPNVSIAGWVQLPTRNGSRDLAYALFIDQATRVDIPIRDAAAELLRGEIREALASFR